METVSQCAPGGALEGETALLTGLIRRFESGISEGHLHTLIYVCQGAGLVARRYDFRVRDAIPFSEDLDLAIALLLWHDRIQIRRNRIFAGPGTPGSAAVATASGSLDKFLALSYDELKILAAGQHSGRDAVAREVRQDGQ